MVVTSAVDGRGIEELRRVLWKLCTAGKTTENQNLSRNESDSCTGRMGTKASAFRLPIDRVFSLKGFGTVVTGTLLDGSLGLNYDAMLYPRAERVKIRGIQVHGQEVSEAVPGQRVAVNLPGIGKEQICPGRNPGNSRKYGRYHDRRCTAAAVEIRTAFFKKRYPCSSLSWGSRTGV